MSTLFVGVGRMGAPMARLYAAEHETVLLDRDHAFADALGNEIGCAVAAGVSEVPDAVDTAILMLPSSTVVEAVLLEEGLLARVPPGGLVIDMGSSVPASTRRMSAAAAERGVGYVDAPVSGGVAKARTGQLTIIVGGETADVERARPHIERFGSNVHHVGPSGAGHAAKALNNLASASNLTAAAEVLTVARTFGIAPEAMVEVLNSSTGRSQASEVKYPKHVLTGAWDSGFAMDLMIKDLDIALELARDQGATTPVTASARDAAVRAREALGGAGLDHTEVARWYETVNDASLRAAHDDDRGDAATPAKDEESR
jgi:3-hydroxyisobutyrate dehydrogenase